MVEKANYKVVVLGEGKVPINLYLVTARVGKSSLTLRLMKDEFNPG